MELHIKTHSDSSVAGSPRDSPIEPEIEISQTNSVGTASDKENHKTEEPSDDGAAAAAVAAAAATTAITATTATYDDTPRDFPYYMYSREQYSQPLLLPSGEDKATFQTTCTAMAIEQPHLFRYPEVSSSSSSTYTGFGIQTNEFVSDCSSSLLNLPGNDARRRVEAALEAVEEERQREYGIGIQEREPILTPPSSNPVSPVPSPDPLDLAIPVRETLILPPRKRCKMILESMESERNGLIASQRQNSVIQFAKAS